MFKRACLLFVASVLAAAPAYAGQQDSPAVQIVRAMGEDPVAVGSLSGTHNSADSTSMIECKLTSWPAVTGVMCQARVGAGDKADSGVCYSSAPELVQTARSIGPSDIIFFAWDKYGTCKTLEVTHTSRVGAATLAR